MKTQAVFKILADQLFLMMFLAIMPAFKQIQLILVLIMLVTMAVVLVLQLLDVPVLRYILPLVIAPFALMAKGAFPQVLTVFFIIVSWALVAFGSDQMSHDSYRYWFGLQALVIIIVCAIILTSATYRPYTVLAGALVLLIGTLVLRRKRMGKGADKYSRILNIAEPLVVIVSTITAGIIIYELITHSGPLFQVLLLPIGYVIRGLIYIGLLFGKLIKPQQQEEYTEPEKTADEVYHEIFDNKPVDPEEVEPISNNLGITLERILLVAAAIAVIVIIVMLILRVYNKVKDRSNGEEEEAYETGLEYEAGQGFLRRRKRKEKRGRSGKQRIRQIYRQYLSFKRVQGTKITRQTTSEEIMNQEEDENGRKLREIYLKARYRPDSQITEEEIRAAEEYFELFRKASGL